MDESVIRDMASRYHRTPAQIVLRWHIQLGLTPIPKSASVERLRRNLDVFDFELTVGDVARLSALDRGEENAFNSDEFGH